MEVLVDTSAILAVLNENDDHHDEAVQTLEQAQEKPGYRFYLTNFILAETYGLINVRLGDHHARSWLSSNNLPVAHVTPEDEAFAEDLLLDREDKAYSYVDAASFAVMERKDTSIAFEFDEHFEQYGWQRLPHVL